MNTLILTSHPTSRHQFGDLFGLEFPPVVIQHEWFHARRAVQTWDLERIAEAIGDGVWLSYYERIAPRAPSGPAVYRLVVLAGEWPTGAYLEVQLRAPATVGLAPGGTLTVYAESPSRALVLIEELAARYRVADPLALDQVAARVTVPNTSALQLCLQEQAEVSFR